MKIGVITLPPTINYGGILQAFALQKALMKIGHEATLIDKRFHISRYKYLKKYVRYILLKALNKDVSDIIRSKKELNIVSANTKKFIDKYIIKTDPILQNKDLLQYNSFDAYIVGSDQVWRPMYVDNIYNYYLDFVTEEINAKKISYAASFGTEIWEYSEEETTKCKDLISKFDAVSCREESGVHMCSKKYNIQAKLVLDPTLLLTKDDYINEINLRNYDVPAENIFSYVLDSSKDKNEFIEQIAKKQGRPIYNLALNARDKVGNITSTPDVEYWLNGIYNSNFVVTDSFHGTVFAIIFNKPFISIVNSERGAARFESLFKMLNIKGNIVKDITQININELLLQAESIDWLNINEQLNTLRTESFNFLDNALK